MNYPRADAFRAFPSDAPLAARTRIPLGRVVRQRLASMSPLLATLLLTGAAFLLPATSDRRQAQASDRDIQVSATHIEKSGAAASRH